MSASRFLTVRARWLGWSWSELRHRDLHQACPLLGMARTGLSPDAWHRLATTWLHESSRSGLHGIVTLRQRRHVIVGLFLYAVSGSGHTRRLDVSGLRVAEPAGADQALHEHLRAVGSFARHCGCRVWTVSSAGPLPGDPQIEEGLARLARSHGLRHVGCRWHGTLAGNVVPLDPSVLQPCAATA